MSILKLPDELCDKYKLPLGWEAWQLEAVGTDANPYVLMTGGVYPETFAKGPRKGRPNFKKPATGTESKRVVSLAEYREIVLPAIKAAEAKGYDPSAIRTEK